MNVFLILVHTARQAIQAGRTRNHWPNPQGREVLKVSFVRRTKS